MHSLIQSAVHGRARADYSFPLLFLVACLAAALPVFLLQNIPFIDMPNHLARFAILDALPGNAMLDEYYRAKDGFYPYYGMNLVFGALLPLVGLEQAGRIFDVLAVLMPSFGAIVLSRAIHGRLSVVSLTGFALSMNGLVAWGFLNYVFSIGIVLMAFGGWVASERIGLVWRTLVFAVVIFATGCVHLISAGILFGLIGAYELARLMESRFALTLPVFARLGAIAFLAIPVALLFAIIPNDELGVSATVYGGLVWRLDAYQSAFALGRSTPEILLGLGMLVPVYIAHLAGLLTIAPRFARMLFLLILAAVAAPVMLLGVFAVHTRLPLIVALVYLAALDYSGHSRRPLALALAASAIALMVLHFVVAGAILKAEDRRISEFRAAAQVIEPGTKVLPAIDYEAAQLPGAAAAVTLFHVASYAVIDRSAFLPTLFGMYEVGVQDKYKRLLPLQAAPVGYEELSAASWGAEVKTRPWAQLADYDYLVAFDQDGSIPPPRGVKLLHTGSYFKIFRLHNRE